MRLLFVAGSRRSARTRIFDDGAAGWEGEHGVRMNFPDPPIGEESPEDVGISYCPSATKLG